MDVYLIVILRRATLGVGQTIYVICVSLLELSSQYLKGYCYLTENLPEYENGVTTSIKYIKRYVIFFFFGLEERPAPVAS